MLIASVGAAEGEGRTNQEGVCRLAGYLVSSVWYFSHRGGVVSVLGHPRDLMRGVGSWRDLVDLACAAGGVSLSRSRRLLCRFGPLWDYSLANSGISPSSDHFWGFLGD